VRWPVGPKGDPLEGNYQVEAIKRKQERVNFGDPQGPKAYLRITISVSSKTENLAEYGSLMECSNSPEEQIPSLGLLLH
jgi:hypothetical protein